MKKSKPSDLYSEADLANSINYLRAERSLQYFADLGLKHPLKVIRKWIREGMLVGRIKNTTKNKEPKANRYEVFLPDISRFKRDMYK